MVHADADRGLCGGLHPLGPLTKNVALAAMLWVLARQQR